MKQKYFKYGPPFYETLKRFEILGVLHTPARTFYIAHNIVNNENKR